MQASKLERASEITEGRCIGRLTHQLKGLSWLQNCEGFELSLIWAEEQQLLKAMFPEQQLAADQVSIYRSRRGDLGGDFPAYS